MDEFSLIQRYFSEPQTCTVETGTVLGIGDDAAILQPAAGESLLFSTDSLISGVHFHANTAPQAIGHKALAVNLSDIAAMAGQARWFTLALTLPEADTDWLSDFSAGLLNLAEQFKVSLVGGDTTRGPLSITVSVIGEIPHNHAVRRSTASPGEAIFVTGQPGMAAIGLKAIEDDTGLSKSDRAQCLSKLNYPQPRLKEGFLLREFVSAMIDVSDGLAADLGHILTSSHCSAILDAENLTRGLPQLPESRRLSAVLYGGDDYELLFTVAEDRIQELLNSWPQAYAPLTRIGRVEAGAGILLKDRNGMCEKITASGYRHFNDR